MLIKNSTAQFRTGLSRGLSSIAAVILLGTFGYRLIESWGWIDCLYMTVITISTVGTREVHDLSPAGRLFTTVLIFFGVGTMAYCLSRLTEFLFQRSITNVLGRKNMAKKISEMKRHSIICGYGRTGSRVVAELQAANAGFVVIERDEDIVKRLQELEIPCIQGDATEEDILNEANIAAADSLVGALDSDADNLYLSLTASGLNSKLRIIVRATDPESARKLRKAGTTRVVSPVASGANQIAQLITRPSVVDLVELVTKDKSIALQVREYTVDEDSEMLNKTLAEARVRQVLGCMVIAVRQRSGRTVFDPGPDTRLSYGDTLITIHQPEKTSEE